MISHNAVDGEPDVSHWYQYLESAVLKYLDVGRWLSLCCGRGELERYFSKEGKFRSCLAVDISESHLRKARDAAEKSGVTNVTYVRKDLNSAVFAENEFDLVIAQGGIHHISRLDNLFHQMRKSLKPGGLFVMHEYVGPIRWKLNDFEVAQINAAMELIPDAFRPSLHVGKYWCLRPYDMRFDSLGRRIAKAAYYQAVMFQDRLHSSDDCVYRTYRQYAPDYFHSYLQKDASESVSGENIVPTLDKYFEIVDVRPIGGTVISWILDFDWGFDLSDPDFIDVVQSLISFERNLIDSRKVSSHYASIVVRNSK
jgi:SAM-dependent methyltransferase